ncbi:PHP domain-containing protein [bacterium]|nr:PHP domain-containing protein [bacterium]
MLIKVDLHNHTTFSFDGEMNPRRFIERYTELGFGAVAVTDHNTRLGALAIRELDPPFKVIVGCEVSTQYGEIIGLFLEKDIKKKMHPLDAAKAIHDAGGITLLPHPFLGIPTAMKREILPQLLPHIDIVEGLNARGPEPAKDFDSYLWGRYHGLAISGGSDAHSASGAGSGYVLMEDFDGPQDFLEKLRRGTIVTRRREMLYRSAMNLVYGKTYGWLRVQNMIRKHKAGAPLRELWDKNKRARDKYW